ncbi:unnamed protein product [Echinostoma caproni]|uniref:Phosphorylase b kinase regulatory subunit n=1 Tax=Echinostoma caproni TaxID=27848 RepID=A0A183BC00_9TREM|nr:unnamed protein product [Echinostoma caproni]
MQTYSGLSQRSGTSTDARQDLEQFKKAQNVDTCLSPRLNYETGEPIDDPNYKNLQMDCVALFVIQLAQMITSGLQARFVTRVFIAEFFITNAV